MKINYKIFQKLTREPDLIQKVNGRNYKIFLSNEEEKKQILKNQINSIFSTNGKEYRVLIEKEAYEYKINKIYYDKELNEERVKFIEKVTKLQRLSLFCVMLPVSILLIVAVTVILILNSKNLFPNNNDPLWLISSLMALIFSTSFTVNRFVKSKVNLYTDTMENNIKEILGKDKLDELSRSIEEYNIEKSKGTLNNTDKNDTK